MTRTINDCYEHKYYWICGHSPNHGWKRMTSGSHENIYCTGYACCEEEVYGTYTNKIAYATHNVINGQWTSQNCNTIAAKCGVSAPTSCAYDSSISLYRITTSNAQELIERALDAQAKVQEKAEGDAAKKASGNIDSADTAIEHSYPIPGKLDQKQEDEFMKQ